MAVTSESVEVNDFAISLSEVSTSGCRVTVKNAGSQGKVADLGPGDVVFGEGFELDSGDTIVVELEAGERLYAISNAAGTTLKILRT